MIVDLDPAAALVAASELNRCAATARHQGRNPPRELELVAEQLTAAALLAQYLAGTSVAGQVHCNGEGASAKVVSAADAARDLGLSDRQVRRRCEGNHISGARRVNPSNPASPWLIPAAYVASHQNPRSNK